MEIAAKKQKLLKGKCGMADWHAEAQGDDLLAGKQSLQNPGSSTNEEVVELANVAKGSCDTQELDISKLVHVGSDDEECEKELDKLCDIFNRHPIQLPPRILMTTTLRARFDVGTPGILVSNVAGHFLYYPALDELPKKLPVELVHDTNEEDTKWLRNELSGLYDQNRNVMHYCGLFKLPIRRSSKKLQVTAEDVVKAMEESLPELVVALTQRIWGDCYRVSLLDAALDLQGLNWREFPVISQTEYFKYSPPWYGEDSEDES